MTKYFLILLLALGLSACEAKETADTLYRNGTIHTGLDGEPTVEALVVAKGRIVYAGNLQKAATYLPARKIDLEGAHLFPGFTDAHAHLYGIGRRETTLNLEGMPSLAALLQRIAQAAKSQPTGAIIGRGWIETDWIEGRFPNRYDLDRAAPGRIVLLTRADGHALVASSKALEAAGIDPDTPEIEGGRIERDEEGMPTGFLIDNAKGFVAGLSADLRGDARRPALTMGAKVMNAYGWTGVHNMSVNADDVQLLENMADQGKLPLRVYNAIDENAIMLLANGPRRAGDDRVITRGIKVYIDGALGSRGAAMLASYNDDPKTDGLMVRGEAESRTLFARALRDGVQVSIHAIGDRANRAALDWIEETFDEVPVAERRIAVPRWRIEHAQMLNPSDIPRFAKLGIIPSMQPSHAIGDLHFARARVGKKRLQGAYAWNSLIEAGSIIPGGSDAPVERGDPRIEFYAAVSRHDLKGYQGEDWHKEEAVDRVTALKMFTLWPAYASFREDELGTIEPGKRADFTVFADDIMTIPEMDILTTKVVMTVVDGEVVYKAGQ
ncbi:MAG: amidohydrolase [Robiginitomaculum sp.]|nr:MAG: amidohydrolase [Robiginitomaculum sp.]